MFIFSGDMDRKYGSIMRYPKCCFTIASPERLDICKSERLAAHGFPCRWNNYLQIFIGTVSSLCLRILRELISKRKDFKRVKI